MSKPTVRRRRLTTAALALLTSAALAGCSLGSGSDPGAGSGSGSPSSAADKTVVLATHDSWYVPKATLRAFTAQTGYKVVVRPQGDAGALTNKLVLTKDSPIADAVYGIDNTFASRAVDSGILATHTNAKAPASSAAYDLTTGADRLLPVDYGDVCVNVDDTWFEQHKEAAPRTLADLTEPAYRDLFVTPGAATSSPGLAFLLATIGRYGEDGWQGYWRRLMANGAKLTSGWSDAYEVDFTAGGGDGSRPIVLSYASSPPFTIDKKTGKPTTSALLDTCFRQVEYTGVLQGASNPKGAAALVDFLQSRTFQEILPDNMYVFPVDDQAPLPKDWAAYAEVAPKPIEVSPADITAHREQWLRQWEDIVG